MLLFVWHLFLIRMLLLVPKIVLLVLGRLIICLRRKYLGCRRFLVGINWIGDNPAPNGCANGRHGAHCARLIAHMLSRTPQIAGSRAPKGLSCGWSRGTEGSHAGEKRRKVWRPKDLYWKWPVFAIVLARQLLLMRLWFDANNSLLSC